MLKTSTDQRKPLPNFEHLFATTAQAPGGVARLRELILTLAVQGKLVPQDPGDEPASELLKKIRAEKERLIAEGKIKKEKPLAAITEEEKPFELPVGWEWVRLGNIGYTNIGLTYSPKDVSDSGVPVLRSNNIQNGKLDLSDLKRVNLKIKDSAFVAEGDLLICARNGSKALVGKTAQINNLSEPMAFGAFMAIFRSEFNSYIIHFINSRVFRSVISDVNTTTINQITQDNLRNSLLPLPPLAEQSRIVIRVEELMRLCDALEEKGRLEHTQHQQLLQAMLDSLTQTTDAHKLARHWQRLAQHFDLLIDRPEAVDALEQTILQLAVRGLLVPQDANDEPASELLKKIRVEKDRLIAEGKIKKDKPLAAIGEDEKPFELPVGWEWTRFGDISINRDGERIPVSSSDREKREKIYDYYGASGVIDKIDGFIFDKTLLLIGEDGANLINRSTPIAFLAHGKYWVNNHAHVIDATQNELLSYYCLYINAISLEPYVTGTAQPKMNQAKLNSIIVPLPPLAEQSRIVARVTELRALCQQLREKLTQARTTQTQLAQAWVEQVAA